MSKEIYFFPFYPKEFYMSTLHMTPHQVGCYMRLLCIQFDRGPIPLNLIQTTCEGVEEDIQVVMEKFKKNKKGMYYNPKLFEVVKQTKQTYEDAKNAGKRGAEKRWKNKKKDRDPNSVPNGSASYSDYTEHSDPLGKTKDPKPVESIDDLYSELYTEGE